MWNQSAVLPARRTIELSQHTHTHVLGVGHLEGYSEYNRTRALIVVRQSYKLYEKSGLVKNKYPDVRGMRILNKVN